jgi:FKBP-type peptidyl-prolyl cis-trans isomerase
MRISIYFAFFLFLGLMACEQGSKTLQTPSGYEYINHTNLGGETAQPGEYVYFHAQMRNGDSIIMTSRQQSSAPFIQIPMEEATQQRKPSPVEDVLKELSVGDSATVMINIDTLPQKPQGFEDVSVLYYDVVVTEILTKEAFDSKKEEEIAEQNRAIEELQGRRADVEALTNEKLEAYKAGTLGDELKETESGLKYIILEEGTGAEAEPGNTVDVHYYGLLTDGTRFDDSFSRGQVFNFPLGANRVIKAWDEGIDLLNVGSKAVLFVPSELGYGERGAPPTIPPNAELVFYVELEGVK